MTLFERLIYIFCCCCFSGFGASKNFIRDSQRLNSVVLYDSVCVCACVCVCVCVLCVCMCVLCVCAWVFISFHLHSFMTDAEQSKSMDWFLHDNGLRLERAKGFSWLNKKISVMPEFRSAMVCWGKFSVSSTFIATS